MLTTESRVDLKEHPIMITLQDAIAGDGFLARITLYGRALMRMEDDGKWWMYGVSPAGIAASGANIDEAFLRFRNRYKEILFDIAQESRQFQDFKADVDRFFNEADSDNEDERLWQRALTAVRCGPGTPPGPFSDLPRQSPETHTSQIIVERVDGDAKPRHFMPSENVADSYTLARAA